LGSMLTGMMDVAVADAVVTASLAVAAAASPRRPSSLPPLLKGVTPGCQIGYIHGPYWLTSIEPCFGCTK
jgi:hypothetical protein